MKPDIKQIVAAMRAQAVLQVQQHINLIKQRPRPFVKVRIYNN